MPSCLPALPARPKQGSFPPAVCRRLHRYYEPLGLPLGSVRFRLPPYAPGLCPTWAAQTGLACSALLFRNMPLPVPRGSPMPVPEQAHCASPSPRYDRLGLPEHLSAENLTRLARHSLCCGLLRCFLFQGFRRPARPRLFRAATGSCYRTLWRLSGRDSHPLEKCSNAQLRSPLSWLLRLRGHVAPSDDANSRAAYPAGAGRRSINALRLRVMTSSSRWLSSGARR